jgi:plasmid stabilization system protein ParE
VADIVFHPEASREYRASLRWYAERSRRAAERFERAIDRVLEEVRRNPARYGFYDDRHREAILPRYPFSVIYRSVPNGDIQVVAVAHASREPGYWEDRTRDEP